MSEYSCVEYSQHNFLSKTDGQADKTNCLTPLCVSRAWVNITVHSLSNALLNECMVIFTHARDTQSGVKQLVLSACPSVFLNI